MSALAVASLPVPPLPAEKTLLAARLIEGLDAQALHWLSGYMAGAAARSVSAGALAAVAAPAAAVRLTVLYGSQTGNAKRVAEGLAERARAEGLEVRLLRADAYPQHELKNERLLYVVISTHSSEDKAEPPDDSRAFFEFLAGRRAPRLPELSFAVLALGDSSYPDFCGVGRSIDARLAELGGTRLFERGEADVDIDTVAGPWLDTALVRARERSAGGGELARSAGGAVVPLHPARSAWTRQHPFQAEVLLNQRIVAGDSGKNVRHIELSLEGSGIRYQPGDALGVWPTQSVTLVDAVLETLGLDGAVPVSLQNETLPLRDWLTHRRELTQLTRPFLAAHAERAASPALRALLAPEGREALAALLGGVQLLDFLREHPAEWDAGALVTALRPLAPRSYSIASSQERVGEEVHLTVALVHYRRDGEDRYGAATRYLFDLAEGERAPVFIEPNERFRLPADPARDVILIGPGTGVAPFRAFVQERAALGAAGRNWLFFGNPHRRSDFLYQLEWLQARKDGHLHRLDVAFSRDQAHKVYVQDRLREQGAELWRWLEGGAHLYVCGDASRMAPDVHRALLDIAVEHGGKSREDAAAWLDDLMAQGRYARDVY